MVTFEKLTPDWQKRFLLSRNSLFTPVGSRYCEAPSSALSTFIAREADTVTSWGSFYSREIELGMERPGGARVSMACAIGTLPDHQRQGLGAALWRTAEHSLTRISDGILVYTGEGGNGYSFYRALGHAPLFYPRALRLRVTGEFLEKESPDVHTSPFPTAEYDSELFAACYRGYAGFMAHRPESLKRWARTSFFYDYDVVGCIPQISQVKDSKTGGCVAYAIWAGPLDKVNWKGRAVEIWELACARKCKPELLRRLLRPACRAAWNGARFVDWWAVPGHFIVPHMLAIGFEELPRGLCVLGKLFDAARKLQTQLQARGLSAKCVNYANRRVEVALEGTHLEIELQAATRIAFGRSLPSDEHRNGLLTIFSSRHATAVLPTLDQALPWVPWCYLASEYI